jgi:hypothetical protein
MAQGKDGLRILTSLLLVSLVFVSIAETAGSPTAFQPVFAATVEDSDGRKHVSGEYVNKEAGFTIRFPDHWQGVEEFDGAITTIYPYLEGFSKSPQELSGVLIVSVSKTFVKDLFQKLLSSPESNLLLDETELAVPEGSAECGSIQYSFTKVNEIELFRMVSECNIGQFGFSKFDQYMFATDQHLVIIMFNANSDILYERLIDDFEGSIQTLRVDNPASLEKTMMEILGLEQQTFPVVAKGNEIELTLSSNSRVSDLRIEEEEKRVTFNVESSETTSRFTTFSVDSVLEGPYVVTADGQPVTDFVVVRDDTDNNKNTIQLSHESSIREIAITGTNVVPEFPYHALLIVSAVIGTILAISRTGLLARYYGTGN